MIFAENILICIAFPMLLAMIFIRGDVRRFIAAFLLGMVICLLSAYISGFLSYTAAMEEGEAKIFLSPVVEEIMKFLPLLVYLYLFVPDERPFVLVSMGIGTGFATFENCCHILNYGAGEISYVMIRGMAVGVMHIVSILMLAMGLILVRRFRILSFSCILGALSLSLMFHGLYNLLVSGRGAVQYIGYGIPVITAVVLYYPYKMLRSSGAESA